MIDDLRLPEGFIWLGRTGNAMPFAHIESGKTGPIPGVIVLTCGANQAELDYQASKTLREIAKDREFVK